MTVGTRVVISLALQQRNCQLLEQVTLCSIYCLKQWNTLEERFFFVLFRLKHMDPLNYGADKLLVECRFILSILKPLFLLKNLLLFFKYSFLFFLLPSPSTVYLSATCIIVGASDMEPRGRSYFILYFCMCFLRFIFLLFHFESLFQTTNNLMGINSTAKRRQMWISLSIRISTTF